MGQACSTDFFASLLKQYGNEFIKWVAGQKAKQFVTDKIAQSKKIVNQKVIDTKSTLRTQLGNQKNKIQTIFNEYKEKIPQGIPGSPQQLLGFNTIEEKFKQLDQQINNNLSAKQKDINSNLDSIQKESHNKINEQQPQIPILNKLTDTQRKQIMDRGQKQFSDQIQQAKNQQMKKYGASLDPTALMSSIQTTANLDSIKNLSNDTKKQFQEALLPFKGGALTKSKRFLDSVFS